MKVQCIILGAPKCGTTSLATWLADHPDIGFCNLKEPEFFLSTSDLSLEAYHDLFPQDGRLWMEASTKYSAQKKGSTELAQKIYTYNSDMKFIYLIRDPVERYISHYVHWYERAYTDLPIETAWRDDAVIHDSGLYYSQLQPYLDLFGPEAILVVRLEDLVAQDSRRPLQILKFLGVSQASSVQSFPHVNVSYRKNKVPHTWMTLKNRLAFLKRFIPKSILSLAWKQVAEQSPRLFHEKPQISAALRQRIENHYVDEYQKALALMRVE